MRRVLALAVLVAALTMSSTASATAACNPAKALRWAQTCWSYQTEGGPFALHLRRLGVLDRFPARYPRVAARFSRGYWPPSRATFLRAVRDLFPEEAVDTVVCIGLRESGWRFDAVSPTGDYGFVQFNRATHAGRLIPALWFENGQVFDSWVQATAMLRLSRGGTWWGPWKGGRSHCGY